MIQVKQRHGELRARTGQRPTHPPQGFAGLTARFDLDKPVIAAVPHAQLMIEARRWAGMIHSWIL